MEASEAGAGAILAVASSLHFAGPNNFFDNVNNTGGYAVGAGGVVYIANNAVFTLHGNNSFINNSAERHCGAIYTSRNVELTCNGTYTFGWLL